VGKLLSKGIDVMMYKFYAALLSTMLFVGCTTTDSKTGESKASNTTKGAGFGALAGAAVGAAVNHDNRAKGAAIGAALGGGVGATIGYQKDKQEAELRDLLKSSRVSVKGEGDTIRLVMPDSVSFDTKSASLRSSSYIPLNKLAVSLNQYPGSNVLIGGHTDNKGTEATNKELSLQRANSVATYLVSQGIDASRLKTAGFGSSLPIGDNNSNMGRAENRRVEIKIISPAPATVSTK
jgi:outer membrane protein OmpA-like peptidoglycan-associated protein